MEWASPQYSKSKVDAAGAVLADPSSDPAALENALTIINNWRSSHSFPLNTLQMGLRRKAGEIDSSPLVAQRIKRLSSIALKIERFPTMKLSQMQDIGGCRAIVRSVRHVERLVRLYKRSGLKHKLVTVDDYIRNPQPSGYRGVHLIYRYYSDKKTTYNGLKIEMQLRSPLQHAWATAVETVGTFIRQALKSSRGEKEWLRFFALMGSAIAIRERTSIVPGTPTNEKEIIKELRRFARMLDVKKRLVAYGRALRTTQDPSVKDAHYFLLKLEPRADRVTVIGYRANALDLASKDYLVTEKEIADQPGAEAVLVSVESLSLLRRAYPNYFLDTGKFIEALDRALT